MRDVLTGIPSDKIVCARLMCVRECDGWDEARTVINPSQKCSETDDCTVAHSALTTPAPRNPEIDRNVAVEDSNRLHFHYRLRRETIAHSGLRVVLNADVNLVAKLFHVSLKQYDFFTLVTTTEPNRPNLIATGRMTAEDDQLNNTCFEGYKITYQSLLLITRPTIVNCKMINLNVNDDHDDKDNDCKRVFCERIYFLL